MKKILAGLIIFSCLSVLVPGCLKDKGFDNHEYGINDADTQPPGVGFPKAANETNVIGLDAFSSSTQVINDVIYINLEAGKAAASEVTITLENDDAIRSAYNTANGTHIVKLNPTLYQLPPAPYSLTVKIPAGGRNVQIPISVLNTNSLSTDSSYGVGIKIKTVSNGYTIAENLRNLLLEFVLKNKYDGKYRLVGYHNRPGLDAPYDEIVYMETSGANSISMFWPALGAFAHPLNGGATYYGSFTANFKFDLVTNALFAWDWSPWPTTLPVAMGPALDSRYDPATKKIYANFYYNNNPGARQFKDTLTYIGPRP